jgi:hypothetical protein
MKNHTRIHTHALQLLLVAAIAVSTSACSDDSSEPSGSADAVTDTSIATDGSADTTVAPDADVTDADVTADTVQETDAPGVDADVERDGNAVDTVESDTGASDGSSVEGCLTNADCDNSDVCDGEEVCDVETGSCSAGTALECTATDVCHATTCDAVTGCSEALIDADSDGFADAALGECGLDCNDDDDAVNPDATEVCDGVDNDCNPETPDTQRSYWADCDGDGFGSPANGSLETCGRPVAGPAACPEEAWILRDEAAEDCCDRSDLYYPESDATITSIPILGEVMACADFDVDCDDVELPTREQLMSVNDSCMMRRGECVGAEGWNNAVPSCGSTGSYSTCRDVGGTCTRSSRAGLTQACH